MCWWFWPCGAVGMSKACLRTCITLYTYQNTNKQNPSIAVPATAHINQGYDKGESSINMLAKSVLCDVSFNSALKSMSSEFNFLSISSAPKSMSAGNVIGSRVQGTCNGSGLMCMLK